MSGFTAHTGDERPLSRPDGSYVIEGIASATPKSLPPPIPLAVANLYVVDLAGGLSKFDPWTNLVVRTRRIIRDRPCQATALGSASATSTTGSRRPTPGGRKGLYGRSITQGNSEASWRRSPATISFLASTWRHIPRPVPDQRRYYAHASHVRAWSLAGACKREAGTYRKNSPRTSIECGHRHARHPQTIGTRTPK